MIEPLTDIPVSPVVAALPKADLHIHQEAQVWLDRLLGFHEGRPPYDWREWSRRLLASTPPGMPRLDALNLSMPLDRVLDADDDLFIARVAGLLEEEAAGGAVLVEVLFGPDTVLRPGFMPLFREAERRVRERYPRLHAEAVGFLQVAEDEEYMPVAERQLDGYTGLAGAGLAGVNFRVDPYDTEANPALWAVAYRWAERAADSGLGITLHAAEFSTANLEAALRVPGITRVGHATYAGRDPRLLDLLAASGVTVECCLSCNVVLGAVTSYEDHPVRQFVERGIPVTLGTDNPARVWTTLQREYAIAAALGFSPGELLQFTRNGVQASFTSEEQRAALLAELNARQAAQER